MKNFKNIGIAFIDNIYYMNKYCALKFKGQGVAMHRTDDLTFLALPFYFMNFTYLCMFQKSYALYKEIIYGYIIRRFQFCAQNVIAERRFVSQQTYPLLRSVVESLNWTQRSNSLLDYVNGVFYREAVSHYFCRQAGPKLSYHCPD